MGQLIKTFKLIHGSDVISPVLITIREYRKWFEQTFDEYTVNSELYMKAKRGVDTVLECHPGTRIGKFFDTHDFKSPDLHCWYIYQDSYMMEKLVDYGMAELRDAVSTPVDGSEENVFMLRVYTAQQIQCYLQTNIDRRFDIASYIDISRHVPVKDINKLVRPKVTKRKGFF